LFSLSPATPKAFSRRRFSIRRQLPASFISFRQLVPDDVLPLLSPLHVFSFSFSQFSSQAATQAERQPILITPPAFASMRRRCASFLIFYWLMNTRHYAISD
jgi:hypothetical protein